MACVAILQPTYPHYREEFFDLLKKEMEVDLFAYQSQQDVVESGMRQARAVVNYVKCFSIGPVLCCDVRPLLKKQYRVLVLMGTVTHFSTWLLLLFKRLLKKKIILWGHGISISRYMTQEKKMSLLYRLMYRMADGAWFYTENEQQIWQRELPRLRSVSLNNTISGVERILNLSSVEPKEKLKKRLGVAAPRNLIFCARFSSPYRRVDILEELVKQLDPSRYGFIIIGDGPLKPDFSQYPNVHDFGAVYEEALKDELFTIADIYIQPGWLGLSVVEALAYGKPVFTLTRSEEVMQCVEYGYVQSGANGFIAESFLDLLSKIQSITEHEIELLGKNARRGVEAHLMMQNMVGQAVMNLQSVLEVHAPQ